MLVVQRGNVHQAGAPSCGYRRGVGAKKVDGGDEGHSAQCYGNPLGIECEACKRRAPVALDRLGTLDDNVRRAAGLAVQMLRRSALKPAHC